MESDHEAFQKLISTRYQWFYQYVLRGVGNTADAEDILQNALTEAYISLHRFKGESLLSSWVFGIAHNMVRSYHGRVVPRQRNLESNPDFLDTLPSHLPDPCEYVQHEEQMSLLNQLVHQLKPEVRQALWLVAVRGENYAQAAAQLKIPIGTLRSSLSRARAQMKNKMRTRNQSQI